MTAARTGVAFDAIAAEYDAVFSNSCVGRAQRQVVWEMLDRVFQHGRHVLEINCGTGVDALHLAERGIRVHACDSSPAMVDVARRRLHGISGVEVERRAIEDLASLSGSYDGLMSNFGGLNCLDNLRPAIVQVKRLVRIGGSAIFCYMGPFCAWEVLWYLAHGKPRKAFRRLSPSGASARIGSGKQFRVHYPARHEIVRAFAPEFRLVQSMGVGVFVPPSYAETFVNDHPQFLEAALRLDRAVANWPVFRMIGDHVLLHFEKVCE